MSVTCKSHLTSGVSVHPENTVTHSAGNVHVGQKICRVFSGTASIKSYGVICLPMASYSDIAGFGHTWHRGFCTLVHSFDQVRGQHLHG